MNITAKAKVAVDMQELISYKNLTNTIRLITRLAVKHKKIQPTEMLIVKSYSTFTNQHKLILCKKLTNEIIKR